MSLKELLIGVDLGGTKIMTGVIDREGNVCGTPIRVPTGGNDHADIIVQRIVDSIEQSLNTIGANISEVLGIGVGATGPVDSLKGEILECPQLPNMHFFNLREAIQSHFNIPVELNNDANCLILAECIYGAAKDKKNVVGFTLGTGLGCAIVLNQNIFNGATGTAAEIWPSPYKNGIIEDYVSGRGVTRLFREVAGKERSSLEVYQLAKQGDKEALQAWKAFGEHLAVPLAWTINLFDPEVVVLGGSITYAYDFFKASMEKMLRKWICPIPAEKTRIVKATLGDYAGFIGAACLIIQNNNTYYENRRSIL